jgi:hypothetical protein
MIKAIGWLIVAVVTTKVSKAIAKKLFPEDWKNDPFN